MRACVDDEMQFSYRKLKLEGDVLQQEPGFQVDVKERNFARRLTPALFVVMCCVLANVLSGCLPLPRAPVEGTVTQGAGAHPGIDFGGPPFPMEGKPVVSICTGTVVFAATGWNGGCGNMISIQHDFGYKSDYCHLSRIDVFTGQQVGSGQTIGAVGNTGNSQGAHLHLQFWLNGVLQVDMLNAAFPVGTTFALRQLWGGGLNPALNCPPP